MSKPCHPPQPRHARSVEHHPIVPGHDLERLDKLHLISLLEAVRRGREWACKLAPHARQAWVVWPKTLHTRAHGRARVGLVLPRGEVLAQEREEPRADDLHRGPDGSYVLLAREKKEAGPR